MSKFGWSYPPGAALDPNAPYNQNGPYICDVCLCDSEVDCQCHECPVCSAVGDLSCYENGHLIDGFKLDLIMEDEKSRVSWCWKPRGEDQGVFLMVLPIEIQVGAQGRKTLMFISDLADAQNEEVYAREFEDQEE